MASLYSKNDLTREKPLADEAGAAKESRPPFRRDYARLIHSPAFRRLQGKTQLFPGLESDFFRNRLTHSIEVAQIAKSIAMRINAELRLSPKQQIDTNLVEFAGLAHDLGHPPFGHNGELALDECMRNAGGFEGNAQTLRILGKLEKKGTIVEPFAGRKRSDVRTGLNLTHRALAAVLKYDNEIPILGKNRSNRGELCKGYYESESALVSRVKKSVLAGARYKGYFKTIECQIMDLADDIAYSTYDLEDALKAGFISPMEIVSDAMFDEELMERIASKVRKKMSAQFSVEDAWYAILELIVVQTDLLNPYELIEQMSGMKDEREKATKLVSFALQAFRLSQKATTNGYTRNQLTTHLVDKFVCGVKCDWNSAAPAFSKVSFSTDIFKLVEVLKNYTFEKFILSPLLKVSEYRGREIVSELFNVLVESQYLLPNDFGKLYEAAPNKIEKKRVVCDFIAGMTDSYAIEFYGRLKSENPQTIFKPL